MTVEASLDGASQVGDDLARAIVRRAVDRAVGQASGMRRGGFREGSHERATCVPSYVHRTTRIPLPADRDVNFRGHVRGAVEMMVEIGVLDSTDEVVILAMLSLDVAEFTRHSSAGGMRRAAASGDRSRSCLVRRFRAGRARERRER